MSEDGLAQQPLRGVILCGTSLKQDVRAEVAHIGQEMGAGFRLNLDNQVTHLLVGSLDSEKYRHVAMKRPDILVLQPDWLYALRDAWTAGEDINLERFNNDYQLPSLFGLRVCITGFHDLADRQRLEVTINDNGGAYHADLTKNVTHLVAAAPTGAKYDKAREWGIHVVTRKWLESSLARGMILSEPLFNPLLPLPQQGRGAFEPIQRRGTRRKRVDDGSQDTGHDKRRLRRTASARLASDSQTMLQDISFSGQEDSMTANDSWSQIADPTFARPTTTKPLHQVPAAFTDYLHGAQPKPLLAGWTCYPFGHEERVMQKLRNILTSEGARMVESVDQLDDSHSSSVLILPSSWTAASFREIPPYPARAKLVTEWWVERSIARKRAMDPDMDIFSRSLVRVQPEAFKGFVISTSGLGQDIRFISRIVASCGGRYAETVSRETTVLVVDEAQFDLEKPVYCAERGIDVVTPQWLLDSLQYGQPQAPRKYYLSDDRCAAIRQIIDRRRKDDARASEKPPNAEQVRAESKFKHQRLSGMSGCRRANVLPLSRARSAEQPPTIQQPLAEITLPNSPERTTQSQAHTVAKSRSASPRKSGSFTQHGKENIVAEDEATLITEAGRCFTAQDQDLVKGLGASLFEPPVAISSRPQSMPGSMTDQAAQLLTNVLARRQNSVTKGSATEKKKRTLGRALSATNSGSFPKPSPSPFVEEEAYNPLEAPLPSQQLSYDAPGAEEYRRLLEKRMGTRLDDPAGGQKLKSLGMVRDAERSNSGSGVADRVRGRHRETARS